MTKELGKITSAEFGIDKDHSYLFGLELSFSMGSSAIGTGGKYSTNIDWSTSSKYTEVSRDAWLADNMKAIWQILKDAKVNKISELIGMPVEVTIDKNTFQSFRILAEVL